VVVVHLKYLNQIKKEIKQDSKQTIYTAHQSTLSSVYKRLFDGVGYAGTGVRLKTLVGRLIRYVAKWTRKMNKYKIKENC